MRCYSGFLFLGTLKLLPRVDGGCQWLTGFGESNSLPFLLPWSVARPMPDVRHSWLHSIAPFFVSQESLLATLSFAVCGMGRHSHALGMPLSVPSGMGNALTKVNVLAWMLCVGEANTVWKSSYIDQTQYFQNPLSTDFLLEESDYGFQGLFWSFSYEFHRQWPPQQRVGCRRWSSCWVRF